MQEKEGYTIWERILVSLSVILIIYFIFSSVQPEPLDELTILTAPEYEFFVVKIQDTGSMRPVITGETKAIVKEVVSKDELFIGNILVFHPDYRTTGLAHRLIDVKNETLVLKGDTSNETQLVDFKPNDVYKVYALLSYK